MSIFIIVVTYNGEKWIRRCIETALSSDIPVKLIVIDNGSSDRTLDIIESFHEERIYLIKAEKNLGFGKANNIGIEYAMNNGAEYVYLLNQDAYVEYNTISGLIEIAKKDPEYTIISPMQYNGDGSSLDKNFQELCVNNAIPDKILKDVYNTNFIMAAHWLLQTRYLKKYGLFNPLFQHYGEDVDFCNRMLFFKGKIGFSKIIKAYHDRSNRKITYDKEIRLYYMSQLAVLTNNNVSFFKAILGFHVFILRDLKKRIIQEKKLGGIKLHLNLYYKILMNFGKIRKSRNKQIGIKLSNTENPHI